MKAQPNSFSRNPWFRVGWLLLFVCIWAGVPKAGFGSDVARATENEVQEREPFEDRRVLVPDPLESWNRAVFSFNDKFYFWFAKPVAQVYGAVLPEGLRICVRNSFDNLGMPVRFVNNVLQGKLQPAGVEIGRFVINSSIGFGGFFEIAARDFNLQPYDEDSGQTLGFYGMPGVFYINWPFLGPSTFRDSLGLAGDYFLNPLHYLSPDIYSSAGLRAGKEFNKISLRIGQYEDFKKSAVDPYVSMRDAYIQHRAEEIRR